MTEERPLDRPLKLLMHLFWKNQGAMRQETWAYEYWMTWLAERMTCFEIDRKLKKIVALLFIHLKLLIQSVKELNEKSSTRSSGET